MVTLATISWSISQDVAVRHTLEENLRRRLLPKKGEDNPLTKAEIGRDYCNQLFKLEESIS